MKKISGKLTVFFENPFWVGIFENFENDNLSVCKVIFGSEPKEYEIYNFILKKFYDLRFSNEMKSNFSKKIKNRLQRKLLFRDLILLTLLVNGVKIKEWNLKLFLLNFMIKFKRKRLVSLHTILTFWKFSMKIKNIKMH